MIKYNICTNFYSNYLYKGLALYFSLEKTSKNFCLWILCMDQETYKILSSLKLKYAKLIKIEDVETRELLTIKKSRNIAEYSWTLKSNFMSYLFVKYPSIPSLFYLDADIFFFNDIKLVFKEIANTSIAIAPHRFPKIFESRTKNTGIFNAGVIFIKKDSIGLKALERWRKQCIKWCYWRLENGKLADQMYLDEWPRFYKNLHQFKHAGVNSAPWNICEYKITKKKDDIYINDKPLIFYHFHQLTIYSDQTFEPSYGYYIPRKILNLIYKPYEDTLLDIIKMIDKIKPNFKQALKQRNKLYSNLQRIKKYLYPLYWKTKEILPE